MSRQANGSQIALASPLNLNTYHLKQLHQADALKNNVKNLIEKEKEVERSRVMQVDEHGNKQTTMLETSNHRIQTQPFTPQSSGVAVGPIQGFDKIQDIGQIKNGTTQTGKHTDLTPIEPLNKIGKSGTVTKREIIMMIMMNIHEYSDEGEDDTRR